MTDWQNPPNIATSDHSFAAGVPAEYVKTDDERIIKLLSPGYGFDIPRNAKDVTIPTALYEQIIREHS